MPILLALGLRCSERKRWSPLHLANGNITCSSICLVVAWSVEGGGILRKTHVMAALSGGNVHSRVPLGAVISVPSAGNSQYDQCPCHCSCGQDACNLATKSKEYNKIYNAKTFPPWSYMWNHVIRGRYKSKRDLHGAVRSHLIINSHVVDLPLGV